MKGEAMAQEQSENRTRDQDESVQDLKEREYRDDQGNVHHHTKKYLEEHPEDKGRPPRSKESGGSSDECD
jgi:hypothetical protein